MGIVDANRPMQNAASSLMPSVCANGGPDRGPVGRTARILLRMKPVFALSFHADYRCANSGVCCSCEWDVPIELPVYRTLAEALAQGRITPQAAAEGGGAPFTVTDDLPEETGAIFARTPEGRCVFFHGQSRLCSIHRDVGDTYLPST